MRIIDKVKARVGRWALSGAGASPGQQPIPAPAPTPVPPGQPNNQPGQPPPAAQPGQPSLNQQSAVPPIEGEKTILSDQIGQFKPEEMTPELIMKRNYAILAKVKHSQKPHDQVLNFLKEFWRIVGPLAFIFFTAGEVYHFLNHYMRAQNLWENILLWGITLLIEIPFCIATYDLSDRKKRALEAEMAGQPAPDKDTGGAVSMWFAMAAVNVGGQIAFMVLILSLGTDFAAQAPLYFFVVLRVVGVIIGDAYTAFFLLPSPNELSEVLKAQKAQGDGMKQLTEAETERKRIVGRAENELREMDMDLQRKQQENDFMDRFNRMNMESALADQQAFLEWKRQNALPPPKQEPDEPRRNPNTGDL